MGKNLVWEEQTYLTRKEVARVLKLASGTLANWGIEGKGPPFVKMEGRVCYPVVLLKVYMKEIGLL
ncbi:helix-turn-helix domain-containing protein [Vibrio breoganii]|uniref:helix-turn-helix domain-containing protein n=1 Tax=Vibrio breoganii TaxID=553239 RepID=UPI000C82DF33|nr:helix-turn-helix domain-containing protein [Vibrio breoganii]PMF79171.1 hypothetical protein BCV08_02210 [Vibrio breoganii]PMH16632.1 hypothetical protein BCU74_01365 [Vibrio breoganii]PMM16216.1 hypothetical protein BCT60_00560 [Vibrio breoganii]TKG15793.1 helix-turn-helix domain-containing protein [Vibrio breoganii]